MPNKAQVKVLAIYCDEDKATCAGPGENLQVMSSGIEEEDILAGFVLCSLQILELLDNATFTAGYKAVLHIHSVVEECEIVELLQQIDPKTKKPKKKKVLFVKNGAVVVCHIQILHNLEGLLFELKEKQLQWAKSWTFLQVPVYKKVLLLEVRN
ncbi:hypothetical protein SLE2022_057400 [Rubroshorea leprosula]